MAKTNCLKCGAEIPDNAAFCPSCGAPKGQPQPASQPMQPSSSPLQGGVSPMKNLFDMAFSKTGIILVMAIGILLVWIGLLINTFSTGNGNVATLLASMGYAAIALFLSGGGIWNKKIDKYARLGMVIVGGLVAINGLNIVNNALNALF